MKYEWDERKRLENIRKHGFDFYCCEAVFNGYTVTMEDRRFDYDEQRFKTLGLWNGRLASIVHTESIETCRIISIRKATRYEQETYFSAFGNGLGQG